MGNKLYVGNLPYQVRDSDLEQAFGQFGQVTSAKVMMERETGRSKGFGFVEMGSDAEAQAAIDGMNGQSLGGRSIVVNEARPMENRPRGFGGGGSGGYGGGGGGGGYGGGGGGGRAGGGGGACGAARPAAGRTADQAARAAAWPPRPSARGSRDSCVPHRSCGRPHPRSPAPASGRASHSGSGA